MTKYFTMKFAAALFLLAFMPALDAAAEPQPEMPREIPGLPNMPNGPESTDFTGEFLHMLVVLGGIIAFLILATWVVRKLQTARFQGSNRSNLIRILESRQLSTRSAVHFIEILNKGIIIGESHAGLVRLAELHLDDDEEESPPETESLNKS